MKRDLLLLGGIGLGAGLMYWLDPDRGRHRRSRTRAQLLSTRHRVGDFMTDAGRELHALHLPRQYRAQLMSPFRRQHERTVSDTVLFTLGGLGVSVALGWLAKSRYETLRSRNGATETVLQSVCDWACGVWDGVSMWFRPEGGDRNAPHQTHEREHEVTMMGVEAESTKDKVESQ